jgi:hypothetical protein
MADLPDGALVACLIGYAQLHGTITLELIGRIPPQLEPTALFDLQMARLRFPERAATSLVTQQATSRAEGPVRSFRKGSLLRA